MQRRETSALSILLMGKGVAGRWWDGAVRGEWVWCQEETVDASGEKARQAGSQRMRDQTEASRTVTTTVQRTQTRRRERRTPVSVYRVRRAYVSPAARVRQARAR